MVQLLDDDNVGDDEDDKYDEENDGSDDDGGGGFQTSKLHKVTSMLRILKMFQSIKVDFFFFPRLKMLNM